jgi:hypothetical protein
MYTFTPNFRSIFQPHAGAGSSVARGFFTGKIYGKKPVKKPIYFLPVKNG